MAWTTVVAHFFGGAFLANAIPHFVNGISGRPFPTPFASPPGRGDSSPVVNVLWGAFNLVVGYLLVYHAGTFAVSRVSDAVTVAIGGLVIAILLAWRFGQVQRIAATHR